jgi:hypothetical protein
MLPAQPGDYSVAMLPAQPGDYSVAMLPAKSKSLLEAGSLSPGDLLRQHRKGMTFGPRFARVPMADL